MSTGVNKLGSLVLVNANGVGVETKPTPLHMIHISDKDERKYNHTKMCD